MGNYFVVFVPDEAPPETFELSSKEDLILKLRGLMGRNGYVRIFRGEQLHISKAPYRYLLEDGHLPSPIFDQVGDVEADADGRTGEETAPDPAYVAATMAAEEDITRHEACAGAEEDEPPIGD